MNLQNVFIEDRKSRREYCAPEQGEGPDKEQVEGSPIKGRVKTRTDESGKVVGWQPLQLPGSVQLGQLTVKVDVL